MPFKNQTYFSLTQTKVTTWWGAVCTCSWDHLSCKKGVGGKSSSGKGPFELASLPSMPWHKCVCAVVLARSGRCSQLLYSPSISPVLKCPRKARLSNYGYPLCLQSIGVALLSLFPKQCWGRMRQPQCLCHRQLLRFYWSRGGINSGRVASFSFSTNPCLDFGFFFMKVEYLFV